MIMSEWMSTNLASYGPFYQCDACVCVYVAEVNCHPMDVALADGGGVGGGDGGVIII